MATVSAVLRTAMEASGQTRAEISRQTGIPESTLSRFASGHALQGHNMDKLCKHLGLVLVFRGRKPRKGGEVWQV